MSINAENISKNLKNNINVLCFDTIDSTNNKAKLTSETSNDFPGLIVARHQTAGRGRLGRAFYSPKDTGLYMSLVLKVKADSLIQNLQKTTCCAAVAVAQAIDDLAKTSTKIKWVNDILLNNKKVSGILCELVCDKENIPKCIIVGVGVNLTTSNFPEDINGKASSIGEVDPNALCAKIADNIIYEYENIEKNLFMKTYKEKNICLGQQITYEQQGVVHNAKAVDIDKSGSLIVIENNRKKSLSFGEISIKLCK